MLFLIAVSLAAAGPCTSEAMDSDTKYLRGYNVVSAEQVAVEGHAGVEAARLHFRAAPGLTREFLGLVLLCDRSRGDEPLWAADASLDVRSELAGFAVDVWTEDAERAPKL